ncbi:hypothetical protein Cs7R123_62520 [Catellatospora sp. TT07R-123]|uniref:hypothetical protein n=1 Tax=Catellatospora sp. TT07R-123 TaxID=2733863 RepID=UPI001B10173E|nr:hypothetical protein [Catellatospora sp. TT07R-123]GHJ48910.1 hypothetical protein Cs7R123_62520 [Catellatospora sp. TT07R-123]
MTPQPQIADRTPLTQLRTLTAPLEQLLSMPAPRAELTYREVVDYFAAYDPRLPQPVRGALLRRRRGGAWAFRMLYLDADGHPLPDPGTRRLLSRTVHALRCDDELALLFADRDLILFD